MKGGKRYIIISVIICLLCFFGIIYFIVPKISFYAQICDSKVNLIIKNATSIQDLSEEAVYYINKRQYYSAIKLYQKVIQNYPYHKMTEGAQYIIGDCYKWAGDYKKAKKAYNIFIKKYPNSALTKTCKQEIARLDDPTYRKVNEAMMGNLENLDKTIKKCQKVIKNSSGQKKIDAMLKIGECYFSKGEYLKAIEICQEIINNYPDYPKLINIQCMMGICYELLGDYGQAKKIYETIIAQHPNSEFANISQKRLQQIR